MTVSDVVIVGGGIAGASLAYALAREAVGVTVLESTEQFPDRVRGESMQVWGVREARELGVEAALADAGAHYAPVWKQYTEGVAETRDIPMGFLVEGIAGSLNLRHPDACQALVDLAAGAGATVVRGVRDVKLAAGRSTTVAYANGGGPASIDAGLVVGADGRASAVRRQTGITLQRQEPSTYIAGLLVDGLAGVPDDHDAMVSEGDLFLLVFHQGGGRARTYICGAIGDQRFSGGGATRRFLDSWQEVSCYPWADRITGATPSGPCASYPGEDTWTDTPFADGIVLIGDAAGYNDPIIGQGLSIAMRDARTVRDLVLDGARRARDFAPYGEERAVRMARLRLVADVVAVTQCEAADNRAARRAFVGERMARMDPEVFPLVLGAFAGPEQIPDELVDPSLLDRIRAAT